MTKVLGSDTHLTPDITTYMLTSTSNSGGQKGTLDLTCAHSIPPTIPACSFHSPCHHKVLPHTEWPVGVTLHFSHPIPTTDPSASACLESCPESIHLSDSLSILDHCKASSVLPDLSLPPLMFIPQAVARVTPALSTLPSWPTELRMEPPPTGCHGSPVTPSHPVCSHHLHFCSHVTMCF